MRRWRSMLPCCPQGPAALCAPAASLCCTGFSGSHPSPANPPHLRHSRHSPTGRRSMFSGVFRAKLITYFLSLDLLIYSYLSLKSVWVLCLKNSNVSNMEMPSCDYWSKSVSTSIYSIMSSWSFGAVLNQLSWISFHSVLSQIVGCPNDYWNPKVKPQARFLSHQMAATL